MAFGDLLAAPPAPLDDKPIATRVWDIVATASLDSDAKTLEKVKAILESADSETRKSVMSTIYIASRPPSPPPIAAAPPRLDLDSAREEAEREKRRRDSLLGSVVLQRKWECAKYFISLGASPDFRGSWKGEEGETAAEIAERQGDREDFQNVVNAMKDEE